MARDPFVAALTIAAGSEEQAATAAAWAAPGAIPRARRIAHSLCALARADLEDERWLLALGPGVGANAGELRLLAGSARRAAREAMLAGSPAFLLEVADGATAGLARLCAALDLDAAEELACARTQNDVLVAFGTRDAEALVVHLACDESVYPQLEHHARVLDELAAEAPRLGLAGLVARSRGFERRAQHALLRQTRLAGRARHPSGLGEAEFDRRLEEGLAPLLAIQRGSGDSSPGADEPRVHALAAGLPHAFPGFRAELAPALAALARWEARGALPQVRVHGDYWLANLMFEGEPARISGIIDWDRSRARGPRGLDALHLGVASVAAWSGVEMGEVLASIWEPRRRHALLARHLARVERALGLTREELEHVALALWLELLWNAELEGAPIARLWLAEMIGPPSAALARWLRRRGADA